VFWGARVLRAATCRRWPTDPLPVWLSYGPELDAPSAIPFSADLRDTPPSFNLSPASFAQLAMGCPNPSFNRGKSFRFRRQGPKICMSPHRKKIHAPNRQFHLTTVRPILHYPLQYQNGLFRIDKMTISPRIDQLALQVVGFSYSENRHFWCKKGYQP